VTLPEAFCLFVLNQVAAGIFPGNRSCVSYVFAGPFTRRHLPEPAAAANAAESCGNRVAAGPKKGPEKTLPQRTFPCRGRSNFNDNADTGWLSSFPSLRQPDCGSGFLPCRARASCAETPLPAPGRTGDAWSVPITTRKTCPLSSTVCTIVLGEKVTSGARPWAPLPTHARLCRPVAAAAGRCQLLPIPAKCLLPQVTAGQRLRALLSFNNIIFHFQRG